MSSNETRSPSRLEIALVLLLMLAAILWYAVPQLAFSLYPIYDIWRSILP
jgi:hypothetical protein